jgi:hypothetical protein
MSEREHSWTDGKSEKPSLSRGGDERRLQADLDRMVTDKLMAQVDSGATLARDLESSAALSLPTFDAATQHFALSINNYEPAGHALLGPRSEHTAVLNLKTIAKRPGDFCGNITVRSSLW